MVTRRQMISAVLNQVSGMSPTADTNLTFSQIYFTINAANAYLSLEKYKADNRESSIVGRRHLVDPSLFQKFPISIDCNGIAKLPATPIQLPFDLGIRSLYVEVGPGKMLRSVPIVTRPEMQAAQSTFWRPVKAVRSGMEIEFFNYGGSETAIVELLTTDIPETENGAPDLDAPYPIAADLIDPVVARAATILAGSLQNPADVVNDGKGTPTA